MRPARAASLYFLGLAIAMGGVLWRERSGFQSLEV
jgi:hypothetical protein